MGGWRGVNICLWDGICGACIHLKALVYINRATLKAADERCSPIIVIDANGSSRLPLDDGHAITYVRAVIGETSASMLHPQSCGF